MATHVVHYFEKSDGMELVDVDYQCSYVCMIDTLAEAGITDMPKAADTINMPDGSSIGFGAWPGGSETDYHVYCSSCGALLWEGMNP